MADNTQIHTHMCYSEFNDIIESVGALDADVISIETARSKMELLEAFTIYRYPNQIGPGVYGIHSPRCPPVDEMTELLRKAKERLAPDQIWVNPDCGLKTRKWDEVRPGCVGPSRRPPAEIEALSRWIQERLGPDVPLHFSTRIGACRMSRQRPPRRFGRHGGSLSKQDFITSTRAMCTTRQDKAPIAIAAANV